MTETQPQGLRARISELTHDVQRGFIAEWAVTIILLLFGTTTLVQAFVIPSASMVGTLLIGDHVLVDKLVFSPHGALSDKVLPYRPVRRGDIIVFRYPLNISQDYVKRAIGLPGDRIHLVDQKLWLNGHAVDEPYAIHTHRDTPELYRDNFPEGAHSYPLRQRAQEMIDNYVKDGDLVVPPGYIFAMGDNRDDSDDSRFWGLVPMENVVGTPLIIYWSFDTDTAALTNGNIGVDHIVDVVSHFFTKTRWSRTFKLIRGYPLK
ncbi:MAG: signal peptidase I [Acidobacteria bacterium]|nr:signal peptidase I [Acidobacteriota bacterium]